MSMDKKKAKMLVVPEESKEADPKSSLQTSIDLQMAVFERFTKDYISYFDEWLHICSIQHPYVFKETNGTFGKALKP